MADQQSTIDALQPCPFCGNDVSEDEGCFPSDREMTHWVVRCGNPHCSAETSAVECDDAIRAWNKRAHEAAIDALRAEVEVLRKRREWLPIESAPKDGTTVLVFPPTWVGRPCSTAKYDDDRYAKNQAPYWKRDDDFGRKTISRGAKTTHWMPLPEPPK